MLGNDFSEENILKYATGRKTVTRHAVAHKF